MSNVLIVDDEENVRMAIRYLADFESYGIGRIFEASNGVEARMVMNNNKVDILFTDICMPESDGVFLMNWVHQRYPNMVIIVISGYQNFDYILQAMRNGAIEAVVAELRLLGDTLDRRLLIVSEYGDHLHRLSANELGIVSHDRERNAIGCDCSINVSQKCHLVNLGQKLAL